MVTLVYLMDRLTIMKEYENLQKTNHITLKDICLFYLILFFWTFWQVETVYSIGTNNHMYKYENPKYTLQYIVIMHVVISIFLSKINSYIQCMYMKFIGINNPQVYGRKAALPLR